MSMSAMLRAFCDAVEQRNGAVFAARASDPRGQGVSRWARYRCTTQSRPQAAEADLSERSLLGMDRQGQQASAVRLWA